MPAPFPHFFNLSPQVLCPVDPYIIFNDCLSLSNAISEPTRKQLLQDLLLTMATIKSIAVVGVALFCLLCISGLASGHGTSYTSVHNKHGGKYEYKIEHSKHGHWWGHAHPHGYGGFGEKHHHYYG